MNVNKDFSQVPDYTKFMTPKLTKGTEKLSFGRAYVKQVCQNLQASAQGKLARIQEAYHSKKWLNDKGILKDMRQNMTALQKIEDPKDLPVNLDYTIKKITNACLLMSNSESPAIVEKAEALYTDLVNFVANVQYKKQLPGAEALSTKKTSQEKQVLEKQQEQPPVIHDASTSHLDTQKHPVHGDNASIMTTGSLAEEEEEDQARIRTETCEWIGKLIQAAMDVPEFKNYLNQTLSTPAKSINNMFSAVAPTMQLQSKELQTLEGLRNIHPSSFKNFDNETVLLKAAQAVALVNKVFLQIPNAQKPGKVSDALEELNRHDGYIELLKETGTLEEDV